MHFKQTFIALVAIVLLGSCTKSSVSISPLASLNVVNASVNVASAKANFTGTGLPNYYNLITTTIAYSANTVFGVNAGVAVPLTVINNTDSTKAIYSSNLNLVNGGIYSLYLAGQATAVDTMLVKESIPATYADSSFGMRFINLSYNSSPITITISATATGASTSTEFTGVAYKSYTAFKKYALPASVTSYIFQVRDATTLAVLGSFTLNATLPRFFNITLAWVGQTGGTGTAAPKVQRINNY